MILMGGMVGSAIFSLSGITIMKAGPAALLSWIIAAALMMIYGLMVAELSSIFPKSGGVFVFPSKALGKTERQGKFWGWISTWGYINGNIVSTAFAALSVGTYLEVGFPALAGRQVELALAAVLLCFVLNLMQITVAGKANTILIAGIVISLMIYVLSGLFLGDWDASRFVPFFTQGTSGATGFLEAVPTAMIAYGAIVSIGFIVSEVRDPNRNVPRSMLIAMAGVVLLYCFTLFSTLGMITAGFLTEHPEYTSAPLYAAAATSLQAYPWLAQVISISAVCSLLSTMLVVSSLTARTMAAAAEGGCLPRILGKNNRFGSPVYATLLTTLVCGGAACFPQFLTLFTSLCSLFVAFTISITSISLLTARKKHPTIKDGFRLPGGRLLPIAALSIILVCYIPDVIKGGWKIWSYTIVWYLLGTIFFFLYQKRRRAVS